uniref:Uncharacterized protein n=1 Tax=Ciona savignyi TaxID=51511 RepID=H2Y8T7_CIOSA
MKTFIRCIRNSTLVSKMKKYAQKPVTGGAVWGVMMLFVDQHNKEEVGDGISSPNKRKSAEYSFCISPPGRENGFDVVCQIASDYVIPVLQDVFFVEMENVNNVQLSGQSDKTVENETAVAVTIAKLEVVLNNDADHILNPRKRHAGTNGSVCSKRSKVATISPPEVHRNPIKLPTTISCTATKKVWQGRRRARRQIVQTGMSDLVQLERKISELLLSESNASMPEGNLNDSFSSDISTPLQFNLTLSEENNKLKLVFQTEDVSTDFMSFFHHVEVFLPNFITKGLKRL